jgi:hypothetical protein
MKQCRTLTNDQRWLRAQKLRWMFRGRVSNHWYTLTSELPLRKEAKFGHPRARNLDRSWSRTTRTVGSNAICKGENKN